MLSKNIGNIGTLPRANVGGPNEEPVGGYYLSNLYWNRLESRPRNQNFDEVLRAEINDPLFMLTRQWQFGEFNAEDTGSAIQAKLELHTTKVTRYQSYNGQVQSYNDMLPLEVQVERQPVDIDYREKLSIGKFLIKQIKKRLSSVDFNIIYPELLSDFAFETPQINLSSMTDTQIVSTAKVLSNFKLSQFLSLVSERHIDGFKFYTALNTSINGNINNTSALNSFISAINNVQTGMVSSIRDALVAFYNWYNALYSLPNATANEDAWDSSRLEYRFDISVANFDNNLTRTPNSVLSAEEYYSNNLDWYSFVKKNVEASTPMSQINTTSYPGEALTTFGATVIPSTARFPGMPANRFWQFEDGTYNFGKLEATTADIAKILFAEFALVYQDDFMVIPYDVPVGTVSNVMGIVVTDVFGVKTFVKHVTQSENNTFSEWEKWNMYNLTAENNNPGKYPADTKILIPPTLNFTHESEPLEKIIFLRDEMANLVWAVEKSVIDGLGGNLDGDKSSLDLREFIKTLKPSSVSSNTTGDDTRMSRYKLGNLVAENWIPFTPVRLPNGNRKNVLQRASMPMILENYSSIPIRPRTGLLRKGINKDDILITSNNADPRYFIAEEEIPRSGIELSTILQRARWFNGKTYLWKGNRKTNGRGEGSSGLKFDSIDFS